jgi:predicted glycogen debranching enzyme
MFKSIDCIWINSEIKSIVNTDCNSYKLTTDKGTIEYKFVKGVLILDIDYTGDITFQLDMRDIYDFDDKGRVYNMYNEYGSTIVEYTKYHNSFLDTINFKKFLLVHTQFKVESIMEWKNQHYTEDEKRKSGPYDLFVFDAFKIKCSGKDRIKIHLSEDKKEATKKLHESYNVPLIKSENLDISDEIDIAYNCSIQSLNSLHYDFNGFEGLFAGLPWFFQFWTRDEAISLDGFLALKKYDLVKKIIHERIKQVNSEGRIPNRFPHSQLGTADGTGWMFKRLYDLIFEIEANQPFEEYFSKKNLYDFKDYVRKSIKLTNNKTKSLLVPNSDLETWMDTSADDDTRGGFRIEIQALWLATLKLSNYIDKLLEKNPEFLDLELRTKQKVKNTFLNGGFLNDGSEDSTVRPNIFLAYYLYPELLEKKEWEEVFDNSIDKLWLDWGGFTTIDKNSALFKNEYSGEDNLSYHRGDSWFFVNNIAAVCLARLNQGKYKSYIDKILQASTTDTLFLGAIGRPSEVSSAKEQRAQGSLFQLWSAATYIELVSILNQNNFFKSNNK